MATTAEHMRSVALALKTARETWDGNKGEGVWCRQQLFYLLSLRDEINETLMHPCVVGMLVDLGIHEFDERCLSREVWAEAVLLAESMKVARKVTRKSEQERGTAAELRDLVNRVEALRLRVHELAVALGVWRAVYHLREAQTDLENRARSLASRETKDG